jgi:hypothetical protein
MFRVFTTLAAVAISLAGIWSFVLEKRLEGELRRVRIGDQAPEFSRPPSSDDIATDTHGRVVRVLVWHGWLTNRIQTITFDRETREITYKYVGPRIAQFQDAKVLFARLLFCGSLIWIAVVVKSRFRTRQTGG